MKMIGLSLMEIGENSDKDEVAYSSRRQRRKVIMRWLILH